MKSFKKFFTTTVLAGLSLFIGNGIIFAQSEINPTTQIYQYRSSEQTPNAKNWELFKQKYDSPSIAMDADLGTPRYIVGGNLSVGGGQVITPENVEKLAKQFIDENQSAFNIKSTDLRIVQNDYVNNRFYITFAQFYNGALVVNSKVNLTIFENGAIPTIKIDYFPNITISTTPAVSFAKAAESVGINQTDTKNKADMTLSSQTPCVLPIRKAGSVSYKLVYPVALQSEDEYQNAIYYVDANTLETVDKFKLVNDATTTTTVQALVKPHSVFEPPSLVNMANLDVNYNNLKAVTNNLGTTETNVSTKVPVSLTLIGPWCKVITLKKTPANISGIINPGIDNKFIFENSNSHIYERMVFYHYNLVKDFHLKLDAGLKCLNTQFKLELQYYQSEYYTSPNAFSSGSNITFVDLHDSTCRMPEVPEILYHEYGHSVNSLFYKERGYSFLSHAANEGIADVTAAMITGNSKLALGYKTKDTSVYIRNLSNTNQYPGSVTGQSHNDGKILSGAFWDLGLTTSLETMGRLMHFARYQIPNDENTGVAYFEWLIGVLIADDDDGNINNGTPHFMEIIKAFGKHGIGFQIVYPDLIKHTPIENLTDTTNAINVDFKVITQKFPFLHSDSAFVIYRTISKTGSQTAYKQIKAIRKNDSDYTAFIPSQKRGSIVEYYISVADSFVKNTTQLYMNQELKEPFTFYVGYNRAILENLESAQWNTEFYNEITGNDINWVLDKPKEINDKEFGYLRPGKDYSESGEKCYMTGNNTFKSGSEYFDVCTLFPNDGIALITPYYDISGYVNPILQFKYFFNYYSFFSNPTLKIYSYTNLTNQWVPVKTLVRAKDWTNCFLRIAGNSYYTSPSKVKFKFEYYTNYFLMNSNPTHLANAIGTALIDDLEILSANEVSGVDDENNAFAGVKVYPNPVTESVTIEANCQSSSPSISIYNSLGEKIIEKALSGSSNGGIRYNLNMISSSGEALSPGVYYYTLQDGEKCYNGKICKK